ncbi:NAD(P)/FAD-dependent oxidoreductase [Alkalilacustris brevis]|uniref:NAD(P)/FAD-dependent oxidoreductase n=1 Tax=Alkalilacustris brevis TaxID=2026338 RepID=UPI000E0CDCEE|nr:FAD-dependent oxidoreductase [Alkalilacustris brevis]
MQPRDPQQTPEEGEIAVIGAGVTGLSIALRLAREGHEVTLIAPTDQAGEGASHGNAGVIADYAVLPLGQPGLLRDLPRLLLSSTSPLSIRAAAIATLAPWLLRFLRQSLPRPAQRNAQALASLMNRAGSGWQDLAAEIDGTELLRANGALLLYESERESIAAEGGRAWQRALGVQLEQLGGAEVAQMEPALAAAVSAGKVAGAAYFPDGRSVTDPTAMMRKLANATAMAGVRRIDTHVTGLRPGGRGGASLTGPGLSLTARHVVIAAGAWSAPLAQAAGARVPLETERGYHLEFDAAASRFSRPVSPERRGFYFCPMAGRLRVAGTVELGGLNAPAAPRRLRALERHARHFLPDLPPPCRQWLGFRPSLPDSLPVIGPVPGARGVWLAFGHGHLGLTLAPVTAEVIADGVAGRQAALDPAPFRPGRF